MFTKDINKMNTEGSVTFRGLFALTIKNLKNDIKFLNRSYSKTQDINLRRIIVTKTMQAKVCAILYESWRYRSFRQWLLLEHSHEPRIGKMLNQEFLIDYCLNNNYLLNQKIHRSVFKDIGYINKKDGVITTYLSLYRKWCYER